MQIWMSEMWAKEPEARDWLGATAAVELKDRCFQLEQQAGWLNGGA